MRILNKLYLTTTFLLICFSSLHGVPYSIFRPELTYTPWASLQLDNYSLPEQISLPETKDSIGWEIPVKSWQHFRKMGRSFIAPAPDDNHMLIYRYKNHGLDFYNHSDFMMNYEGTFYNHGQYNFYSIGWQQQAQLNNRFFIHSRFYYASFRGDLDTLRGALTSPLLDAHKKTYGEGDHYEFGNQVAGISYISRTFNAALGRGRFQVGNSITGSIILSDRLNEYPYASSEARFGPVLVSIIHGSLVADSTLSAFDNAVVNQNNIPDKYFALHQFNWLPRPNFNLFAGETIVYGGRSFDLDYLLPHGYWRIQDDTDHDRDNATMYAGFEWKLKKRWLFHATVMMDEFRPEKTFHSWWGNKFAYQGGISHKFPLYRIDGIQPRLTVEFTAIRPWVYTHHLLYSKYSNDNRCLGFPHGANLLHYAAKLELPLPGYSSFSGYASYMRQGSDGSNFSIFVPEAINTPYSDTATWLQGRITKTYTIENSFRIGILAHHKFLLGHQALKVDNDIWRNKFVLGWQFAF